MIFRKSDNTAQRTAPHVTTKAPARVEPNLTARPLTAATPQTMTQPQAAHLVMNNTARRSPLTPANSYSDQVRRLTVGRDISLNGEITTCDHLTVEGTVTATIKGGKMLDVTECGSFTGVVDIEQADIAGTFDGELTVRGKLIIRSTARVTGTLNYTHLQVDTGAQINGTLQKLQQPAEEAQPTAATSTATEQPTSYMAQNNFGLAALNDTPGFLK